MRDSGPSTTILRGGRVVDPSRGIDAVRDVAFEGRHIVDVNGGGGPANGPSSDTKIIDVSGCLVCPGLIDSHVHTYGGIGPVPPDVLGVGTGVTTVFDAGSAGSSTIDDLVALVEDAKTTVRSIVYIQSQGIGATGYHRNRSPKEIGSVNVGAIMESAEVHSDVVCGIKGTAQGEFGPGWVRAVKLVAAWAGQPAYFHLGSFEREHIAAHPTPALFRELDTGDIITHMYTPQPGRILDEAGKVHPEILNAQARGVAFDIGFGRTGFAFAVAERGMGQGLMPTMISSDIQLGIRRGEVHTLLDVASALMCLGVTVEEMIPMMTSNVVRAFGLPSEIGSLAPGTVADISVLEVEDGEFTFTDTARAERKGSQRLSPRLVVKEGEVIQPDPSAVSDANRNLQICDDVPEAAYELSANVGSYLQEAADLLRLFDAWEPEALQTSLRALAEERGITWKEALTGMYVSLTSQPRGPQLAWWLEILRHRGFDVPRRFETVAAAVR